jgi:hypothetical protein
MLGHGDCGTGYDKCSVGVAVWRGLSRVALWKGLSECLSPLGSWVRFLVRPILHVIERVTLFDSVGFLQEIRIPPTLHCKLPNIV